MPAHWAWLACGLYLAQLSVYAQEPEVSTASISYVASVKPSQQSRRGSEYAPGGRLTATAVTVRTLLRLAYRIQDYQLVGAPAWLSMKRFDISAKAEDNPPPSQQILLQALLRDRFHLAVHREMRQLPTFALMLSRGDGKLGPQLRPSNFDCAAYLQGPHPPPELGRTSSCSMRINRGALSGRSISMAQLAAALAPLVQRFTVDQTGLSGGFDVELTWTPEPPNAATTLSPAPAYSEPPGLSIFAALQEQLGLKLASEKGLVETLIIDQVQEPSGN